MVLVAAAAMVACGSSTARVRIHVTPATSRMDQPFSIAISGLQHDQRVRVQLSSTDATATPWLAQATFEASGSGDLDLDRAHALGGSYRGVFGMGLMSTMTPTRSVPPQDDAYMWGPRQTFRVSVSANRHTVASRTFYRTGFPGVSATDENLAQAGFVGRFLTPSGHTSPLAILFFGGSEGGMPPTLYGSSFALHGYRTLELAYFDEPGLPSTLSDIPLEYFAKALRWLHSEPGVRQVLVAGGSRGSEAALMLGAHYPTLVQGVVASAPSSVGNCGISSPAGVGIPRCNGAAWTLDGRPLPYTLEPNIPRPTDDPAAVIPVAQIHAPILLNCGGSDQVWASCVYANAIEDELRAAHDPLPHPLYAYPLAGHGLGALLPYEPPVISDVYGLDLSGTTLLANAEADANLWPHVLSFLAALARQ